MESERGLMEFGFEGQQVRVVMKGGEPWWVAKDVAEILGYTWNGMARIEHVPDTWRGVTTVVTPFGAQQMAVLSEQGLYFFLGRSDKPKALPFQMWLAGEVVPSIRKSGGYNTVSESHRIPKSFSEALRLAADLQEKLEQQKPLVIFAETCLSSKDSILVRELAKVAKDQNLKIGQNRLYERLREWGLILKDSTEPSQKAMDAGYFEVMERPVETPYGQRLTMTTKVTPRGQVYIIERLRGEQIKAVSVT